MAKTVYKNTFSGSVGAGIGSLFNPNGRKYYILEHKVSSKYHKAGESQEIIVDNIELGRDSHCQVRFDESFGTVSRRHAAIVREGDMWKLVQLSKTNTTLLNGRPVENEWYLQNGDEIQLSVNGPKLGFIVPQGKKSTVGSIGLTRRLSLFRQQALRPYKTAIAVLSIVLVLAVGGLMTWNFAIREDFKKQGTVLAQEIQNNKNNARVADSLARELVANNAKMAENEANMERLRAEAAQAWQAAAAAQRKAEAAMSGGAAAPNEMAQLFPHIYYIAVFIYLDGERQDGYFSGTGFLLNDGRFVTAQHCVNLWESIDDEMSLLLNVYAHNGGDIRFKMVAVSNNDRFEVDYSPSNNPWHWGKYELSTGTIEADDCNFVVKYSEEVDQRDYAWIKTDRTGGLAYDAPASAQLPAGTRLHILGFPKSVGAEDINNITPIYSESSIARTGLDVDGCLLLSNNETDHGNSGGPVLIYVDGQYKVVGILSGANRLGSKSGNAVDGAWKTRVVPLSAMR